MLKVKVCTGKTNYVLMHFEMGSSFVLPMEPVMTSQKCRNWEFVVSSPKIPMDFFQSLIHQRNPGELGQDSACHSATP